MVIRGIEPRNGDLVGNQLTYMQGLWVYLPLHPPSYSLILALTDPQKCPSVMLIDGRQ